MTVNHTEHLVKVLTAVRNINRIIVKEKNPEVLIDKVCQSLVESREYRGAWIVLFDAKGKYSNSSEAGIGPVFEEMQNKFTNGIFPSCCLEALRSQALFLISDSASNCSDCLLFNSETKHYGFTVPLVYNDRIYGVLMISAQRENIVQADEKKLLVEVAEDLGFALHSIEIEEEKIALGEKMIEEQFLMNTLMDNLPDYVYFKNKKSEFIRVNNSLIQLFGKESSAEILGKTDFDFYEKEHASEAFNAEQNIIKTSQPIIDFEEKEIWPDGNVTWVSTTKMPLIDAKGNAIGTFGLSRDITKQKLAEESLENSQEMFRKMGEGALDSMIMINERGSVEYWNPAAEKMFGFTFEEVKGKNVHSFIMPEQYAEVQQIAWHKFVKSGEGNAIGKVVELSAKKSNGDKFPIEIAMSTMQINNRHWALASIRDITVRKKAEELARERDVILQKVTENVSGMIFQFELDLDGKSRFPYCSAGIHELFGLNAEDVKADSSIVFDFVSREDIEALHESILESAANNTIWRMKFRIIDRNGLVKWIKGEARPQKMPRGVVEWYGYIYDITKEKESSDSLRLKSEQFKLVVEGSNDGIWDWNLLTNELYLSPRWKQQLGYAADEIENTLKSFEQLLHPEDRENVMQNLAKYLDGKLDAYDIEYRMSHKSGEDVWIQAKGEAVRDKNNKPIRMAGSHSDITDRIRSREKLENEFKRTSAIMNSVQSGIIMVRKRDRVVVDANPAVEKIVGVSRENFVNQAYNTHFNPKTEGETPIIDHNNEINNAECYIRNQHNELIPILKNISEIVLDGEEYLIESFVDIREQKETEKQLVRAKEQADLANKAKSEFLANMSHEIRTPMNSILGFSEVLLNKIKNEKYLGYLRTILSSGRTLLSLINDILDLSKIEAGRLEIEEQAVNIYELVNEVVQLFAPKAQEKNINLQVDIDETFPASVNIDEIRVRQVLLNIIGNALKFTSVGFVNIELKIVQRTKGFIDFQIAVQDSGVGISQDYLNSIFDSFSQEITDSTRNFEGTGLGLAISRRLCELMNGTIRVESELGKGSTFIITLNRVSYSNELPRNKEEFSWNEQQILFNSAKILVVDDIEFNRDLVETFTEELNLNLIEAENGEVAVALAREHLPDLILMDIKMPVLDGYGATEKLRKIKETSAIPIIALTASTMQSEDAKIHRLFDGYLRKPVQRKALVLELARFLSHEVIVSEGVVPEKEDKLELESSADIRTEIKKEFNEKFAAKLIDFENGMVVDEFEKFATQLNDFADKNELKYLRFQVQKLLNYIAEFEFNEINRVLRELIDYFKLE
jgi:PAS domain S-box-containing protein